MSINVGTLDRIARIVVGIALIAFALGLIAPGTGWNWVGRIGVVPILTALFGVCPAYARSGFRRAETALAPGASHHVHQLGDLAPLVGFVAAGNRVRDAVRHMVA